MYTKPCNFPTWMRRPIGLTYNRCAWGNERTRFKRTAGSETRPERSRGTCRVDVVLRPLRCTVPARPGPFPGNPRLPFLRIGPAARIAGRHGADGPGRVPGCRLRAARAGGLPAGRAAAVDHRGRRDQPSRRRAAGAGGCGGPRARQLRRRDRGGGLQRRGSGPRVRQAVEHVRRADARPDRALRTARGPLCWCSTPRRPGFTRSSRADGHRWTGGHTDADAFRPRPAGRRDQPTRPAPGPPARPSARAAPAAPPTHPPAARSRAAR